MAHHPWCAPQRRPRQPAPPRLGHRHRPLRAPRGGRAGRARPSRAGHRPLARRRRGARVARRAAGRARPSRVAVLGRPNPESLFSPDGDVRTLAVSEVLPPLAARRRAAVPVDVTRTVEALHDTVPLDICHVHDPFAPSVPSAALRHSRALNVGTFHLPAERVVSTQVARRVVELVFGRLDARTTTWEATAQLMDRFFPASYRVVRPGVDYAPPAPPRGDGPVRIAFAEREERPALRAFLRALRALDPELPWEAVVLSARGPSA